MQALSSISSPFDASEAKKMSMDSFEIQKVVGRGAYGEVVLAKNKETQQTCAIKILEKHYLAKEKKQYQAFIEKEVLSHLQFVGVVKLLGSFQDQTYLYFVLEFCEGGEFACYLKHNYKFLKTQSIQFYSAEVVEILENLHSSGIIHRDLKPENLMLTKENHLKIIDFGTCGFNRRIPKSLFEKINNIKLKFSDETTPIEEDETEQRKRSSTFVGTAEYVSPELLEGEVCTAASDLWALGCLIYRMCVGNTPFIDLNDVNEFKVFNQIKAANYMIPKSVEPNAADLIKRLLVREPSDRLGCGDIAGEGIDYSKIKNHAFFAGINWSQLRLQKAPERMVGNQVDIDDSDLNDITNSMDKNTSGNTNASSTQGPPPNLGYVRPVITGKVLKKVAWMIYKPRHMILLDDPPKLMYYDCDTNEKKGEIPLNKSTVVEFKDKQCFNIEGVKKKYFFKELDNPANVWVERILKVISKIQS